MLKLAFGGDGCGWGLAIDRQNSLYLKYGVLPLFLYELHRLHFVVGVVIYVALFDFEPNCPSELAVKKGDRLEFISKE